MGVPIWLDLEMSNSPWSPPLVKDQKMRRLVIAQDVGGAIKGVVRGDLFFGHGPGTEELAGQMKQTGRYFILLPKTVTPPN